MSTLRADNYANRTGTEGIPAATLTQGTAKAWLNMNGTGTIATRDSFNVSSIVDNGTGDYTMNYAVAQPNANYSFQQTAGDSNSQLLPRFLTAGTSFQLAASFRTGIGYVSSIAGGSTVSDGSYLQISIHGDPV